MTTATCSTAQNDASPSVSTTPNFNRLARLYRWMEYLSFGPWLWWCRCAFVSELTDCRNAAIFGDGDGRFTARLLKANSQIEIDAVDASESMLRALVRRAGRNAGSVHTHCEDARTWEPSTSRYDLIATHFFLDCLTTDEVRALAVKMHSSAAHEARWIVSEFAEPESGFKRIATRSIVSLLYRAFGLLTGLAVRTLPDHRAALRESGFTLEKRRTWLCGLLTSEVWRAQCQTDG
jgi:ubiquinone/menaquinone biosynthesis C-methylase UbiE